MRPIITTFLLVFCAFLFQNCDKVVISNPAYAIGTIDYYDDGGEDTDVGYTFIVGGDEFGNNYSSTNWGPKWLVPYGNYKKGDMFMVEYDAGCVNSDNCGGKRSRMLFNYPVHDSADYHNYVAQFATEPPNP